MRIMKNLTVPIIFSVDDTQGTPQARPIKTCGAYTDLTSRVLALEAIVPLHQSQLEDHERRIAALEQSALICSPTQTEAEAAMTVTCGPTSVCVSGRVNYQARSSTGNTCVARTATVPCASCLTCSPTEVDAIAAATTTCNPTSRCQSGQVNYQELSSAGGSCVSRTVGVNCVSCAPRQRSTSCRVGTTNYGCTLPDGTLGNRVVEIYQRAGPCIINGVPTTCIRCLTKNTPCS